MLTKPSPTVLATGLVVSSLLTLLIGSHFIGFNASPSAAPVGFYWRLPPRPGRGKLVEVCLPEAVAEFAIARGYIGYGSCPGGAESVGKIVLGMPGDTVDVDPATVLKTDSFGRPMGHAPFGTYHVPAGQIWLHGSARNSWDSRYFSSVPITDVIANLTPLWTRGK
jgi:conjugative transfer signal peptidase TraF